MVRSSDSDVVSVLRYANNPFQAMRSDLVILTPHGWITAYDRVAGLEPVASTEDVSQITRRDATCDAGDGSALAAPQGEAPGDPGDGPAGSLSGVTLSTLRTAVAAIAAASALAAAGILAGAGSATAAVDAFADARGDMSQGADLGRVQVVNGADTLRINVVHRDLVRSFRSGSSLSVFIDTDRARTGPEYVFLGGTFEGADYALVNASGFKAANNRQVPLNGGSYRMTLDYATDVARISIDQVILNEPAAVRIEVKTGAELLPPGSTEPGTTEVDWLGTPRSFTPRVPRG